MLTLWVRFSYFIRCSGENDTLTCTIWIKLCLIQTAPQSATFPSPTIIAYDYQLAKWWVEPHPGRNKRSFFIFPYIIMNIKALFTCLNIVMVIQKDVFTVGLSFAKFSRTFKCLETSKKKNKDIRFFVTFTWKKFRF